MLDPGTDATRAVLKLWPGVGEDGVIDRTALGRIVFADPAELAALEAIVHPATREALRREIAGHPDEVVVVEMPLLRDWFDEGWVRVVVDAPDDVRVARVLERGSSMTESDVRRVIERQPTRAEFLLASNFAIDNRGGLEDLHEQCELVWRRITAG